MEQLGVLLEDVLHEFVVILGAGVVQQGVAAEVDLLLQEKVGGVGFDLADHLVRLVGDHQRDQVVVDWRADLLLEGCVAHFIIQAILRYQ